MDPYLLSNSKAIYFPFRQSVNNYYLFRGALTQTRRQMTGKEHRLDTSQHCKTNKDCKYLQKMSQPPLYLPIVPKGVPHT